MTTYTARIKQGTTARLVAVQADNYPQARQAVQEAYPDWFVAWVYRGTVLEAVKWLKQSTAARMATDDPGEMTQEQLKQDIEAFEQQYGMTSAQLLAMQANGTAPDSFDHGLWLQLLKYVDEREGSNDE